MSTSVSSGASPTPIALERPAIAPPSLLRDRRLQRVVAILAAVAAVVTLVWWFHYRPYVATDDARVAAPTIVVAPQGAGGRVERVLVEEGSVVKAGEKLVELDSTIERAQLERARALVVLADARVGEAEAQLAVERRLAEASTRRARAGVGYAQANYQRTVHGARAEEIARGRAELAAAEAQGAQAQRDLQRSEALAAQNAIPAMNLEAARTAAASARASVEARRAALELLEHGSRAEDVSLSRGGVLQAEAGVVEAGAGGERVALRARQVEEARAQAAQARAEGAVAEAALARMTLASPVAGTVVRVGVDPGDTLATGQGAITVVDLAHAWIAANVKETATSLLRPGQPASVSIDEGGALSGHVQVVTQAAASQFALIPADNAAGNFTKVVQRIPVRIAIDPSPRVAALRVGESVEVRIRVR